MKQLICQACGQRSSLLYDLHRGSTALLSFLVYRTAVRMFTDCAVNLSGRVVYFIQSHSPCRSCIDCCLDSSVHAARSILPTILFDPQKLSKLHVSHTELGVGQITRGICCIQSYFLISSQLGSLDAGITMPHASAETVCQSAPCIQATGWLKCSL